MSDEKEARERFDRLVEENPDAFDDPDCRPLRTLEETGISTPPYLQKLMDERKAELAEDEGEPGPEPA